MEDPPDLSQHYFHDDEQIFETTTSFTPFHLVHGVESVLPIECHILSLRLVVELLPDTSPLEQGLLMLEQTTEERCVVLQIIEAVKNRLKSHYDSHVHPRTFREGDLVLVCDQANDKLGKGKFDSMWYGPYVIYRCLDTWAYVLANSNDHLLKNPHNGIYLKRFYARSHSP